MDVFQPVGKLRPLGKALPGDIHECIDIRVMVLHGLDTGAGVKGSCGVGDHKIVFLVAALDREAVGHRFQGRFDHVPAEANLPGLVINICACFF